MILWMEDAGCRMEVAGCSSAPGTGPAAGAEHGPLPWHSSPVLLGLCSAAGARQEQSRPQGAEPTSSQGWKWEQLVVARHLAAVGVFAEQDASKAGEGKTFWSCYSHYLQLSSNRSPGAGAHTDWGGVCGRVRADRRTGREKETRE